MSNITDKNRPKDKISINQVTRLSHISFSFKYLTSNKNYNFSYFKQDVRKRHDAYEMLFQRMKDLCRQDMISAKNNGKITGCEPIPCKQLSTALQTICKTIDIISNESFVSVFRFGQNNYRMLCKTDLNLPNLLHIIAFDFNYSAYDHG